MQQVVDLQEDRAFQDLDVGVLSISPDPASAWTAEGKALGVSTPMLTDDGNGVATAYGVMRWAMPSGEPGHTFVLVNVDGAVAWIRDYGAPENGGAMYVPTAEIADQVADALGR
ncbi:MAG: redoxin domain-containing protein [Actinomycetota bacterium]